MLNLQDDDLVKRVAQGEEKAFLALYDRYASRVYALALRMLNDSMSAEEATQDVFLKLWTRARSYLSSRGEFSTWLLAIARNVALDRLRLEKRRPNLLDEKDPEESWELLANGKTISEEARWRSLYFALQLLTPEQRQVLELAYFHGLSHSEIAEALGWPIGTVKTRLRLGMEQLRIQWLEGTGEQDASDGEKSELR